MLRAAKKQKNRQDFDADGPAASKDTFFFDFGGRLLDRWCSSSLVLFSSAIYSCLGDLATCFTCLQQSKQAKKAHVVCEPWAWPSNMHAACLACSTHQPASPACTVDLRRSLGWWLLLSSWGSHERHRHCVTREKNSFPFVLGTAAESPESSLRSYVPAASSSRRSTKHIYGQWLAVKSAVRCLLLTTNEAGNKHHALAKSPLLFETSSQKTNRRHPTPFPNTNEVECMLATGLHDLLLRFNARHTQPAADRGRPGLWRHLLAHSG